VQPGGAFGDDFVVSCAGLVGITRHMNAPHEIAALYRRIGPVIYSHCRRLLRDDALAEDALQEVFMRVLRAAPVPHGMLAWVRRIATNYCLNQIRNRALQAEPVDEVPETPSDHPEHAIIDRDLANKLLKRSSDHLRAPVVLYYVDEMKQAEVARALGVSSRTVTYRFEDFAARSRQLLEQEWAAI
jgi:RNA polymerase sigma-70 factor (ECF subfamily)